MHCCTGGRVNCSDLNLCVHLCFPVKKFSFSGQHCGNRLLATALQRAQKKSIHLHWVYVCLVPPPQWSPWLFSCWKLTWMTAKLPLVRNRTGKQWEMKRGILFKTGAMSILLARRLAQLWWDCSVSDLGVSLARPPSKANCSNGIKWKPILVWTGSWCAINTFVMFEHLENIIQQCVALPETEEQKWI